MTKYKIKFEAHNNSDAILIVFLQIVFIAINCIKLPFSHIIDSIALM